MIQKRKYDSQFETMLQQYNSHENQFRIFNKFLVRNENFQSAQEV